MFLKVKRMILERAIPLQTETLGHRLDAARADGLRPNAPRPISRGQSLSVSDLPGIVALSSSGPHSMLKTLDEHNLINNVVVSHLAVLSAAVQ